MKISKGFFRGKGGSIGERMVYYTLDGKQVARRLPERIRLIQTQRRVETLGSFTELSQFGAGMELRLRNNWANCFNDSAYIRNMHDSARHPSFMAVHNIKPGDWLKAFMFCNLIAAHSNISWPRLKAPMSRRLIPPNPIIKAEFDPINKRIIGELRLRWLSRHLKEARLRLWVACQYVELIGGYLAEIFDIGGGERRNIVIPFTLDAIRCVGVRFDRAELAIKDMLFGSVWVYADCVAAHGDQWGTLPSAYSNVEQIVIPRRGKFIWAGKGRKRKFAPNPGENVSAKELKILKDVRRYNTKRHKRGKIKTVKITKFR
ncbi:MAG: hypothetical protein HY589_04165 [Candidatus Omnitrophica bacterium]|nr:hypothetical protein [Candidatus Omnitrophota bacterium]